MRNINKNNNNNHNNGSFMGRRQGKFDMHQLNDHTVAKLENLE